MCVAPPQITSGAKGSLHTQGEDCEPKRWLYLHCITDTTPGTPLSSSHLNRRRWGDCSILTHSFVDSCSRALSQSQPTDVRRTGGAKPGIFTRLSYNFGAAIFMDCATVTGQPLGSAYLSPLVEFRVITGGHKLAHRVIFCKWALQPVAMRLFLFQSTFRWGAMEGRSWRFWIPKLEEETEKKEQKSSPEETVSTQRPDWLSYLEVYNPLKYLLNFVRIWLKDIL